VDYDQDVRRRVLDLLYGIYREGEMAFIYKESCAMTIMALIQVLGVPTEKARSLLQVGRTPGQRQMNSSHLEGYMSERFGQVVVETALDLLEASEEEGDYVRVDKLGE
jgi:hypothetical protein